MSHLKSFGIENFRVFKEKTEFEFAPITVLTGTNSSGKSSLVRAMQKSSAFVQRLFSIFNHLKIHNGGNSFSLVP
jgi:AAA15 family ATPase/GTPase